MFKALTRFDQLAVLGNAIPHEDQIDYKSIADQVAARETPPSITEIHEKRINHELKLQALATASSLPITANVVLYSVDRRTTITAKIRTDVNISHGSNNNETSLHDPSIITTPVEVIKGSVKFVAFMDIVPDDARNCQLVVPIKPLHIQPRKVHTMHRGNLEPTLSWLLHTMLRIGYLTVVQRITLLRTYPTFLFTNHTPEVKKSRFQMVRVFK